MSFRGGVTRLSELIADVITGALIRTRESGRRLEINTDPNASAIRFYTGDAGESGPATVRVSTGVDGPTGDALYLMELRPPGLPGLDTTYPALMVMSKDRADGTKKTEVQAYADRVALFGQVLANGGNVVGTKRVGFYNLPVTPVGDLPNNGFWYTVYSVQVPVPAGAKTALITGRAVARAGVTAAGYWRLRVYDLEDEVRFYNEGDVYQDLSATMTTIVGGVEAFTFLTLYIYGNNDATSSGYIDTRQGHFSITYYG